MKKDLLKTPELLEGNLELIQNAGNMIDIENLESAFKETRNSAESIKSSNRAAYDKIIQLRKDLKMHHDDLV